MTWADPIGDVRKILSDGPRDKLRYRKKVIGPQTGTNVTFKTFEFRRVTDFTAISGPEGVFVDDIAVTVAADDLGSGEFVLDAPPSDGQILRATYYIQWFLDSEIEEFLKSAAEWIGLADSYTAIGADLRPAAKEYAASVAYQKLVSRFSENLAEIYQLFDAPDERRFDPVKMYMDIGKMKYDLALQLRNDVYKNRKGQALAPITSSVAGRVTDVAPNR